MRIAIVTPLDARSAIARVTLEVAELLADLASIVLYAEPTDRPLPTSLPVRPASSFNAATAHEYDHIVTVVGNSSFHTHAIRIACQYPTVVILHDVVISQGVASLLSPAQIVNHVKRSYGSDDVLYALDTLRTARPFWARADSLRLPLTELVVKGAEGIVTHSAFAADLVAPLSICPISVLKLPWPGAVVPAAGIDSRRLVTLGHANPNKQHERVIRTLCHLSDDIDYVIAGQITPSRRAELTELSEAHGVAERVKILSDVPEALLPDLLRSCGLAMGLRHPPLEAASASILELMRFGLPVVVFDHGSYSELPDDAVLKVPLEISDEGLAEVISNVMGDQVLRKTLSESSQSALKDHVSNEYAACLYSFFEEVQSSRASISLISAIADATEMWEAKDALQLHSRWSEVLATTFPDITSSW